MGLTKAKKFEQVFSINFQESIPNSFCYRLYDTMSGFKSVSNVSDFICYKKPDLYLIDCKTHAGNTISLGDFSQFDSMIKYKDIDGVHCGTIVWFYEHDECVVWVPIETWEKIKIEGKKSFNVKMIDDPNYECLKLPSKKRRVFCDTNYLPLIEYYNKE